MKPFTIVIITSGQPSANPRLVKEATALSNAGYAVTVVYVPLSLWADPFDEVLFRQYPGIRWIRTGYHPYEAPLLYKWARIRRKFNATVCRVAGNLFNAADYSGILFGQELLSEARKHRADLYIAHNLGALPVAVKLAGTYRSSAGFDAEDFHRGEFEPGSESARLASLIEEKYFPRLDYLTVASPLIGDAYAKLIPGMRPVVLNNTFSLQFLGPVPVSAGHARPLRLFWFSQFLGRNRGLEEVLQAIGLLPAGSISLDLMGNCSEETKFYLENKMEEFHVDRLAVCFRGPVQPDEIFGIASGFDLGLSTEVPYCLNRRYCLTNKIFTYLLAGNALILSDTAAQKKFLEEHPGIGRVYESGDAHALAAVLRDYLANPGLLLAHRQQARRLAAETLNWETEQHTLIKLVENVHR